MLSSSLKFSVFLVLSQFVLRSQQQCLGTSKMRGNDYTFALAEVGDSSNPLGPQEACYFGCGAQIVTQSSNRGDMARLTLMDNAAPVLTSSGFLQAGQTYYLNHLGMEESEGGNGIGCIQVLPGNRMAHYPREHQLCQKATVAICGFWGKQSIPAGVPRPKPSTMSAPTTTNKFPPPRVDTTSTVMTTRSVRPPTPITSATPVISPTRVRQPRPRPTRSPPSPRPPPVTTPRAPAPKPTTSPIPPPPSPVTTTSPLVTTTTSLEEILPEIQTMSNLAPLIDEKLPAEGQAPLGTDILHRFNVDGRDYHVVNKDGNSFAQANKSCRKSQTNMGGVTSAGYQAVAQNLQQVVDTTGNKLIIGSWNGDNYSLRGNNCLIMQLNNGIYPGSCAEATAVLCQS